MSRKKPIIAHSVAPSIEQAVVQMAIECPAHEQLSVSNALKKKGMIISSGGVRSIGLRHDLNNLKKRFAALKAKCTRQEVGSFLYAWGLFWKLDWGFQFYPTIKIVKLNHVAILKLNLNFAKITRVCLPCISSRIVERNGGSFCLVYFPEYKVFILKVFKPLLFTDMFGIIGNE